MKVFLIQFVLLNDQVKSFSAACNLFDKQFAKLNKQHPTSAKQLRVMIGLTRGFDSLLLKAITGPSCGQYNGKYDEKGMDGQNKVSEAWRTVCLRGGVQKKFLFWVNQWFYLVSLVQKIGDPSGAHQFLAFLPIFMAKNCPKKP